MFITRKRHEREKLDLAGAGARLTDAILANLDQGVFLIDGRGNLLPQVSRSLATLFRRQDFTNASFEKLLVPIVSAKTLNVVRNHIAALLSGAAGEPVVEPDPFSNVDVRLVNPDGSFDTAHYSFEFAPIDIPGEPRIWLVRVSDITTRLQATRELDELRAQLQTQGEILRSVLQLGGARFGALLQRTDASMKAIDEVLKKPAREQDAFRRKLEETLDEVDRVRREAAAVKLTGLEGAARVFEDSLHELRSRTVLSGGDFLPLAVKLDQLYGQFALLRTLTVLAGPIADMGASQGPSMTHNGTQIIEAPNFTAADPASAARPKRAVEPRASGAQRSAPAGSLDSTLQALTDHVAEEHHKSVLLHSGGLALVPPKYQAAIKNIAIQLIRNAVMHGIEMPAVRAAAGKPAHGTLRLEFKTLVDGGYELYFEDDGRGLDADQVRATAIARGVISAETAARLRDREAIKLIFKSRFTTLAQAPGDTSHGAGMSFVRRYVHESGGKIAIATLFGHETRFKISLPALTAADVQVA